MYVGQSNKTIFYVNILIAERPTRHEVLIQLACIDASWRSIGNGLGVSFNFLQGLAESNHSNQVKLDQVIQRWQEMDGKDEGAAVTWSTIFDVVKGPLVQNKTLAMKIYDNLKQESYAQQSTQSKYSIVSLVARILKT